MYSTAEFKKGLKIELDGVPYTIVDFQHVKPGKGGAFVRTKMKSLLTGRVLDQTFRSGEKVKKPDLMEREMQYLYGEGGDFHMMDNETYEQMMLTEDQVGEAQPVLEGEYGGQGPLFQPATGGRRGAPVRGIGSDSSRTRHERRHRRRRHQARHPGKRFDHPGAPVHQ